MPLKFEEKYPDIKVNFVNIPGNFYLTKLKSALQTSSKAPDVFMIENGNIRELIDVPYLENLSPPPYNAAELIKEQYPLYRPTRRIVKGMSERLVIREHLEASIIAAIWRRNIWGRMTRIR